MTRRISSGASSSSLAALALRNSSIGPEKNVMIERRFEMHSVATKPAPEPLRVVAVVDDEGERNRLGREGETWSEARKVARVGVSRRLSAGAKEVLGGVVVAELAPPMTGDAMEEMPRRSERDERVASAWRIS